jgi:hypothetical protein
MPMTASGEGLAFLFEGVDIERQVRLRELHVLAALILNWNHPVVGEIEGAIVDPLIVDQALAALARAPTRRRRQILASFGALHGLVQIRTPKGGGVADDGEHCPRCGL